MKLLDPNYSKTQNSFYFYCNRVLNKGTATNKKFAKYLYKNYIELLKHNFYQNRMI
jgi:hypothetical protein